ncbi:MAG TPA: RNA polymerase sigma factor [Luteimonas sp.]|nr:RNA polymerase sigma factor [Luteimonas sp.]
MLQPMRPEAAALDTSPAPATGADSLDGFLDAISARAFRFAESGLRHREDALDAVQDAMLKMLRYRDRPADEWTPLFWTILRSRIVDVRRRRTFRLGWLTAADAGDRPETVEWADDGPDPARAQEGREAYALFVQALRALPRRQREAFSLRVLEDLDVATTARVMGCSEGSVKTHLSRARAALQIRLEDVR